MMALYSTMIERIGSKIILISFSYHKNYSVNDFNHSKAIFTKEIIIQRPSFRQAKELDG